MRDRRKTVRSQWLSPHTCSRSTSASTVSTALGIAHTAASIAHGMRPSRNACTLTSDGRRGAGAPAGAGVNADARVIATGVRCSRETGAVDGCCFSGFGVLLDEGTDLPALDRNIDTDLCAPTEADMDSIWGCGPSTAAPVAPPGPLLLLFCSGRGPSGSGPVLGALPFVCASALSRSSESGGGSVKARVPVYE